MNLILVFSSLFIFVFVDFYIGFLDFCKFYILFSWLMIYYLLIGYFTQDPLIAVFLTEMVILHKYVLYYYYTIKDLHYDWLLRILSILHSPFIRLVIYYITEKISNAPALQLHCYANCKLAIKLPALSQWEWKKFFCHTY